MRLKNFNAYYLIISFLFLFGCLFVALYWPKGTPELWINARSSLYSDQFFLYVTEAGHGMFYAAAVIALLFVRLQFALIAALTGILCSITSSTLKRVVYADSPRPPKFFEDLGVPLHYVDGSQILYSYSFPSGHTMTAFALFFLLSQFTRPYHWGVVYALLACAVGLSRVYLLKHFFIDVFTGGLIGVGIAAMFYYFLIPRSDLFPYRLTKRGFESSPPRVPGKK